MTLGDGLASLIPPKKSSQESRQRRGSPRAAEIKDQDLKQEKQEPGKQAVFQIEIDNITPNPYQPRRTLSDNNLRELAQSIREVGIIQPIIVSKVETETSTGTRVTYQLISGERRLKAANLAGLKQVPVIVRNVDAVQDKLSVALIENIQREDLNPIEKAKAYARLQDEFGLTQREIAAKVGKSRESVTNTLRLLNLPSHIQEAVAQSVINESQARVLLAIKDAAEQERIFSRLLHKRVSARKLRDYTKQSSQAGEEKRREDAFWERQLEERLETPTHIYRKGEKGKITFSFSSREELKVLLNKLLGKER